MVTLNHAIARAMLEGPAAGLQMLDALEPRLAGHHRFHAVRAHLLEMWGDCDGALAEYRAAARKTASVPEQRYLLTRAARLTPPADVAASAERLLEYRCGDRWERTGLRQLVTVTSEGAKEVEEVARGMRRRFH